MKTLGSRILYNKSGSLPDHRQCQTATDPPRVELLRLGVSYNVN